MHSPRRATCVTSPVQGRFKPRVNHHAGIATKTLVQLNYHNYCYIAISGTMQKITRVCAVVTGRFRNMFRGKLE